MSCTRMIAEDSVRTRESSLNGFEGYRIQTRLLAMRLGKRVDHVERVGEIGLHGNGVRPSDNGLLPKPCLTRNLCRPKEVIAHQGLCGLAMFGILVGELLGNLFLKFKGKHIEIAAGIEMKKVSNLMMKRQCVRRCNVIVVGS